MRPRLLVASASVPPFDHGQGTDEQAEFPACRRWGSLQRRVRSVRRIGALRHLDKAEEVLLLRTADIRSSLLVRMYTGQPISIGQQMSHRAGERIRELGSAAAEVEAGSAADEPMPPAIRNSRSWEGEADEYCRSCPTSR